MRMAVRLLGLDLFEFTLETGGSEPESTGPGDCTAYPLGFTAPETPPEYPLSDRDY